MNSVWDVTSFVDLDDTLFSSLKRHARTEELEPAATLSNGEVISFSNSKQRFLRNWLENAGRLIPVTARNEDAYRRVLQPFSGPAILSHGATIISENGTVDAEWQSLVHRSLNESSRELLDLLQFIQATDAFMRGDVRSWLVYDESLPVYAVLKDNTRNDGRLQSYVKESLTEWIDTHPSYGFHCNGNNVAIIAPGVRKEKAVEFIIERTRRVSANPIFIGVGDSLTDEPFMSLCDFTVLLRGTQLWNFVDRFFKSTQSEKQCSLVVDGGTA